MVADAAGDALAVPCVFDRVCAGIVGKLATDGWTISEDDVMQAVAAATEQAFHDNPE